MGSCDATVTDNLYMKCVCMKFVLHLLTDDQCEQCQKIACDLFEHYCEDVQFLKNIMIGDESWVYEYDPETKQQSSQCKVYLVSTTKKGAPGAKQNKGYVTGVF